MVILIVMAIGFALGYFLIPDRFEKVNSKIQLVCTCILIFSMGAKLGNRENFLSEISDLGLKSLVFALIPIALSVIFVFFLTERLTKNK